MAHHALRLSYLVSGGDVELRIGKQILPRDGNTHVQGHRGSRFQRYGRKLYSQGLAGSGNHSTGSAKSHGGERSRRHLDSKDSRKLSKLDVVVARMVLILCAVIIDVDDVQ